MDGNGWKEGEARKKFYLCEMHKSGYDNHKNSKIWNNYNFGSFVKATIFYATIKF